MVVRTWDSETLAVLRTSDFRAFVVSRACASTAMNLYQAAILWQIYDLTRSPVELGVAAFVRFVPTIGLNLVGGAAADTFDRRKVVLLAQVATLVAAVVMLVAILTDAVSLFLLYGLVLIQGAASSFEGPGRQGLIQVLAPRHLFRSAIVVNQTLQATAAVTGPALAGIVLAWRGADAAYVVYVTLLATSILSLLTIGTDTAQQAAGRGVSLPAMLEGLTFLWHRRVLLGIMALDLFAVIFGGARTLLPIYAVDILHAGAAGYGVLSAASQVGSLVCAAALLVLPKPSRTGPTMLATVAAYGVATILFGLSTSLPLAVLFYAATGVFDQISVVMRATAIQLSTPDELRGRVTGVHSTFTNSSGQIGAIESGFVAAATNAMFSVVSGGAAVLVVVGLVAWLIPELRAYRARPAPPAPATQAACSDAARSH
jgi:MFS family permease